jgi:hypothetical protein
MLGRASSQDNKKESNKVKMANSQAKVAKVVPKQAKKAHQTTLLKNPSAESPENQVQLEVLYPENSIKQWTPIIEVPSTKPVNQALPPK